MEWILSERRLRHYLAEVRGWGSETISWMDGVKSTALRMKGLSVAKRVRELHLFKLELSYG